ncbi:YbhB/YbcL family Raf kinase inhibitor-like protein [Roseibium sp. RKSG952]|uniref:YbhB/YbcL family Raf kinase inhibitor-like protein n=1 Tax=Roseibium sp. RKSG952 TaxID=2529384 RepID=UPI0012BC8458|nr:YbhB/YbcL family Raf kinase inhibitor-like protein [Roseibium sp. RKSG952]MTH96810.1 hypothetical protein [Roseibium sp. RKSG952]
MFKNNGRTAAISCLLSAVSAPQTSLADMSDGANELTWVCTETPLHVEFPIIGRHYSGEIHCGTLLLQQDIAGAPEVTFENADPETHYTLMMIDPDANADGSWPDAVLPGTNAPVRHWIVGNISGRLLADGFTEDKASRLGETISVLEPFHHPNIFHVSDRYGLFVFAQPELIEFEPLGGTIRNFDYRGFNAKYRLSAPKASNFFVGVYTSVSPFSGEPFHGIDVGHIWHKTLGEGHLVPGRLGQPGGPTQ